MVYFANKIGDAVLTLPTVRALAAAFVAPLTLVCPKVAWDLCFHEVGGRFVDITGLVAPPTVTPPPIPDVAYDAVRREIGDSDVLLNAAPYFVPSNVVGRPLWKRIDADTSVGFSSDGYPHDVVIPRSERHSADLVFELARLVDPAARIEDHAQPVSIGGAVRERAQRMRADLPERCKVLAVHADTEWAGKQWPMTRFIDLLDRFLGQHDDYVAWVVGMGFETLDVGRHGHRVVSKLGLPLDLTAGLVGASDLFVGIDSSMLHVADLAGVPGVGIFGPTRPSQWGFRFGPHRHVSGGTTADVAVPDVLGAMNELAALA